jgi:hypothetical protein
LQTGVTSTFLFGASKVGAIPLAVAFHKGQSEESYTLAFEMIKNELGPQAFGGKGSPASFRIDDSKAEYNALKAVWPESEIFLCTFHVLQSMWRWLWQAKNNIDKSDRQHLILVFRQLLYSQTSIEYDEICISIEEDVVVKKYKNFLRYLKDQWLARKHLWALCYRQNIKTRGNHTNNYVESAIRIFKEVILVRCKAFNVVALLAFVVTNLEKYHIARLLKFTSLSSTKHEVAYQKYYALAKGLSIKATPEPTEYLVSSSKDNLLYYKVNLLTETCDCLNGQFGKFCKHLFAVANQENLNLFHSPRITFEDRVDLATMALGKDGVDPSFYRQMDLSKDEADLYSRPERNEEILLVPTECMPSINISEDGAHDEADEEKNDELLDNLQTQFVEYRAQQERLMSILEKEPPSHFALKVLRQTNAKLASLTTPDSIIQFLKCEQSSSGKRSGKKIAVNSTSICRRTTGSDGTRYGGSRRLSSGKKPKSKENAKPSKKKRTRNLMENIYANQQNGKSHGDGH